MLRFFLHFLPGLRGKNRRRRNSKSKLANLWKQANTRAKKRAYQPNNYRSGRRQFRNQYQHLAATADDYYIDSPGIFLRGFRLFVALLLLPLCLITTWTFMGQFSVLAHDQNFWVHRNFWYFSTGALLMSGWFLTGLCWRGFLYLYVLGHELTHIAFIKICLGKVSDWEVTTEGGYVSSNKSNILISLAPYTVPLWSVLILLSYAGVGFFVPLSMVAEKSLYLLLGFSWTFHLLWTLWMIPRDQPDLREHGVCLSLVLIYLANLILIIFLTATASPLLTFRGFITEWLGNAGAFAEFLFLTGKSLLRELRP